MQPKLTPAQLQAQNQAIFSQIARRYDFMNKITSMGMEPFWKRKAVRCLTDMRDDTLVLDLCGGTGDLTNLALGTFRRGRYVIYDLNPDMLRAGMHKIPAVFRDNVAYLQGDALRMPFADGSFDKIMICFGLRNLPDVQLALHEMARVLKPGGQLVCLEFAIPQNTFFRFFYTQYMRFFVNIASTAITGQKSTYRYLADSIANFAPPAKLLEMLRNGGLHDIKVSRLFCGVGYIYDSYKA